jgi:type IV pilus assembly protein PilM
MSVLGIYFGPKAISLVETENYKLINNINIPHQKIFGNEAETKVPDEIKMATLIKEELEKNNIDAKEVNIALMGRELIIRTFQMPILPQGELYNAVRFEAKKYIPFKVEELFSDYQLQIDKANRKSFVLFVGIKKENLQKYISILSELNIKPNSVEYAGFSTLRLLKLSNINKKGVLAVVNIDLVEDDEVNFIVLENGLPLFSRDITTTQESPITPPNDAKVDLVEKLEKLKVELRISLDFYLRKFPTKNIKSVVFIASDEYRVDLEAFIRERGLSAKFIETKKLIDKPVSYSLGFFKSYSCALSKKVKTNLKIDLLSGKGKPKPQKALGVKEAILTLVTGMKINLRFVFLGLLILAIPFAIDLFYRKPVEEQIVQSVNSRPKITSAGPNTGYDELAVVDSGYKEKMKDITGLLSKRLFITETLDTIPRVIPKGVWLKQIYYSRTDAGTVVLTLNGSAFLGESDKELRAINKFLVDLKASPSISKNFKNINTASVENSQLERTILTNFTIICKGE